MGGVVCYAAPTLPDEQAVAPGAREKVPDTFNSANTFNSAGRNP